MRTVNKGTSIGSPVESAVERYVARMKERCARNRMTVTLWLLFDTVAEGDGSVRDRMLREFKKHAKAHSLPRSVAEGAKWLAEHWVVAS